MKVCMISGFVKYSGGVERVVNELSSFLNSYGCKVTVFGRYARDFVETFENYKEIGIKPFDVWPAKLRFAHYEKYSYSLKVWRKIRDERPFDIIHGHGDNCFFPSLFRGETPLIMTFHGILKKALASSGPKTIPLICTEKVAALRCNIAVACSRAVKNELVTLYGVNPQRITVIHNGVDISNFVPEDESRAKRKLKLPLRNKYALWVGTDPIRKGLPKAMKVVEKIPGFRLIVVGLNGKNTQKVIFLGKISESELISAYNAADFLLFPTNYEGFPLVPLEALACGLPIIVSKESNLGEIIEEGVHGFVVKDNDPMSYREKIMRLLSQDLEEMSFKCRELAVNYSWERQAEKYWKVYLSMLGK
ncbi:MAG: glycosyltransferase family 4 protein [Candidatus Jordarchaeaceae archaeon]